jgi:hypothetical protein
MTTEQLQRRLNEFFKNADLGYPRLRVDGERGHATNVRIRQAKFYLGYKQPLNSKVNEEFTWRLDHPNKTNRNLKVSTADVKRGAERRADRREAHRRNEYEADRTPHVTRFDGVPVSSELVPYLQWARDDGWDGLLVSGWRSPAYSESLCYGMCGAPSCAGRCAGRSSRHSQLALREAAIDVAHYQDFAARMRRCPIQPPLRNTLGARDPVHFSVAGN